MPDTHEQPAATTRSARVRLALRAIMAGFAEDEVLMRAAALAFYSALSFAPLVVILLWCASMLGPEASEKFLGGIASVLGERAAHTVDLVVASAETKPEIGTITGWIGVGVTLFGASALFAQLQRSINRVWNIAPQPGRAVWSWMRTRLHALGLLATLAFLLMVSFAVSAVIAIFITSDAWLWRLGEYAVSLGLFSLVFMSMFTVLPDARIPWRETLAGALATAVLFSGGKLLLDLYVEYAEVGGAYGPAGSIVVLLLWMYFSSAVVLLGAEITQAIALARGIPVVPHGYALSIEEDRAVNGAAPKAVHARGGRGRLRGLIRRHRT